MSVRSSSSSSSSSISPWSMFKEKSINGDDYIDSIE